MLVTSKDTMQAKLFPNFFLKVALGKERKMLMGWKASLAAI
jgi:hypothetical protein